MEKDIVPDLLDKLEKEFKENLQKNKVVIQSIKDLETKKATYKNANEFSIEVGEELAKVFKDNLTIETLPDGRMYFNIADRILNKTMGDAYEYIADYSRDVQTVLNKISKISIKGIKASKNQDRIDKLIDKISNEEDFEKVKWLLDEPIKNFAQSIVDDTIRENVESHYKMGLQPQIKRVSVGNCCDWCKEVEGEYKYPDEVPDNIYKRHRYCRCRVDYYPGNGKVQNVHSKKWKDIDKSVKIEKRIKETNDKGELNIKLKNIVHAKAKELGYNPLSQDNVVENLRNSSKEWIELLTKEEVIAIKKYTDNGIDSNGKKLFEKINGFLSGYYEPENAKEEDKLINFSTLINNGLLKNVLKDDIIVYRRDTYPEELEGVIPKFLSTSVTQRGVFSQKPNVAIIVKKGTTGAYVEKLSNYEEQREFILNRRTILKRVDTFDDFILYEVEG